MDCPNVNWTFSEFFKEFGLISIGSCNLHVLNNVFKTGANTTGCNLYKLMKPYFQISNAGCISIQKIILGSGSFYNVFVRMIFVVFLHVAVNRKLGFSCC